MSKIDWNNKFNKLITSEYKPVDDRTWKFSLEEDKNKGTLQCNIRLFNTPKDPEKYSGPSKSGFIMKINDIDDIKKFKNEMNNFFDKVLDFLKEE